MKKDPASAPAICPTKIRLLKSERYQVGRIYDERTCLADLHPWSVFADLCAFWALRLAKLVYESRQGLYAVECLGVETIR